MVDLRSKTVSIALASLFALIVLYQGITASEILNGKAQAQDSVTHSLERWENSFRALEGSRKAWDTNYQKMDSIQDLLSLMRLVNFEKYDLVTNIDDVVIVRNLEQVVQNNAPIGLTKICLASGTGSAMVVQAENYHALLEGLNQLTRRPDIHLGNITIQGNLRVPQALLGDFCVQLRNS